MHDVTVSKVTVVTPLGFGSESDEVSIKLNFLVTPFEVLTVEIPRDDHATKSAVIEALSGVVMPTLSSAAAA